MQRIVSILLGGAVAASTLLAYAQDTSKPPACAAIVAPPSELAAWTHAVPLALDGMAAKAPALRLNSAVQLHLLPKAQVRYTLLPQKPGGAGSFGGTLTLDVARSGNYRFALSDKAWLDVVDKDGAQASITHGHGPECSGIRKMVDFHLAPGHYTIQLTAEGSAEITLLAVALP